MEEEEEEGGDTRHQAHQTGQRDHPTLRHSHIKTQPNLDALLDLPRPQPPHVPVALDEGPVQALLLHEGARLTPVRLDKVPPPVGAQVGRQGSPVRTSLARVQ